MKRVCRGRSEEQRKSEKRAAWRSALECFLLEVSASLTLSMMGLERGRRCCNARGGLLFPCCALVFAVRLVPSDKGKRGARIAVGSLRSFVVTSSSAAVEHTALGAVFFPPQPFPKGRRWRVPSQRGFQFETRQKRKKCDGKRMSVKEEVEKKKDVYNEGSLFEERER